MGPYDFEQRSKKYNVQFSEDGNLVSYITLTQYEFMGAAEKLQDKVRGSEE